MSDDFKSVHYDLKGKLARIQIDDGKRNALSPQLLREIYAALDRAEADKATVILTGRESVLSAGFDLSVMKRGGVNALNMLRLGYSLTARVLAYPHPVVVACNGHCLAMGVFLMLSGDYVVGTRGDFRISANEVAIGLPMPRVAAAMLEHRLTPAAYQRAVVLSEYFDTDAALQAGFFDELVDQGELLSRAETLAVGFSDLFPHAHRVSKRRIRKTLIRRIRRRLPLDLIEALVVGVRGPG